MGASRTERIDPSGIEQVSGSVAGGVVLAVLGLLHVFVLQVSGLVGGLLLFVVWPLVGGAVAARLSEARTPPDESSLPGVLAGAYGAGVVSVVVLLAGVAGLWTPFIHGTFGVTLWAVVFTVFVVTAITWTVFGYAGGYLARRLLAEE